MVNGTSPRAVAGHHEGLVWNCGEISIGPLHASLRNQIHHSLSPSATPIAAAIVVIVVGPLRFSHWFESGTLIAHWSAQQDRWVASCHTELLAAQ